MAVLTSAGSPILPADPSALSALTGIPAGHLPILIASLTETRHLIATPSHIAVVSLVSAKLHSEKTNNRRKKHKGKPVEWTFRSLITETFPALLSAKHHRPRSYKIPHSFSALLDIFEHHHTSQIPADVEPITQGYLPGELSSLLTALHEQQTANRKPILLYTRKSVTIALRRKPATA